MGSSWPLVCGAVLIWASLSSASTGLDEQREVTFDLDLKGIEDLMQKEVDWEDLFNPEEFPIEQIMESPPEKIDTQSERGGSTLRPRGRQPNLHPRSFGGPPSLDYPVQFPLGRPTLENLQAICLHGDRRPRYPDSYFPASGFGQLKRRANAINKAEAWFSTCCDGNQTWAREVTLCCTTQAWELSVKSFCREDSSVKDHLYHCCRLKGKDLFNCFNKDSPNPNYAPTEEIPLPPLPSTANFTFEPRTCQRTVMTPHSVRGESRMWNPPIMQKVMFPPAKPTQYSIQSLCRYQSLRPVYNLKDLKGQRMLVSQAKIINKLEKKYKRCCKKKRNTLVCAEKKWQALLGKFCSANNNFQCCSSIQRSSCLHSISPDPLYNFAPLKISFSSICNSPQIAEQVFAKFPGNNSTNVDQCCSLPEGEKAVCAVRKIKELTPSLCSLAEGSYPALSQCCKSSSVDPDCMYQVVSDVIIKATSAIVGF